MVEDQGHPFLLREIQLFCDRAEELYNNIINVRNHENLPSPLHWLYHQDHFRLMWYNLRNFIHDNTLNFIFDHRVIEYMEYMYTAFPAGFGIILKRQNENAESVNIIIN